MKKKLATVLLTASLVLAGCGGSPTAPAEEKAANEPPKSHTLVVYFSYLDNVESGELTSSTYDVMTAASIQVRDGERLGTNKLIAQEIEKKTGAEIFSIKTKEKYPADYDKTTEIGKQELESGARPELEGKVPNLDAYDTVFLVYPIWWSDMPAPYYTFLDENDLSGKRLLVVASSGGSNFGNTIDALKKAEPQAELYDEPLLIDPQNVGELEKAVDDWLKTRRF